MNMRKSPALCRMLQRCCVLTCRCFRAPCHLRRELTVSCCVLTFRRHWSLCGAAAAHTHLSRAPVDMDDLWAGALWALNVWLYLIICLIMLPAMFGFSLGISETYMTVLVQTLEVCCFSLCRFYSSKTFIVMVIHVVLALFCSGRL